MQIDFAEMSAVPLAAKHKHLDLLLHLDPLDEDQVDDEIVLTSRRAISRVALVATETGSRFQREAIEHDPMAWMLAPRRVFDGRPAIDACLGRDDCLRGVLVHGLGLGLDVEREAVDLLADDDDDEADGDEFMGFLDERRDGSPSRSPRGTRSRLFTAVIAATHEGVMVQAFHASFARGHREVRARLAKRYSREVAETADIRRGFHQASPLVIALVPTAIADLIRQVEDGSATVGGYPRTFAIDVQQSVRA